MIVDVQSHHYRKPEKSYIFAKTIRIMVYICIIRRQYFGNLYYQSSVIFILQSLKKFSVGILSSIFKFYTLTLFFGSKISFDLFLAILWYFSAWNLRKNQMIVVVNVRIFSLLEFTYLRLCSAIISLHLKVTWLRYRKFQKHNMQIKRILRENDQKKVN